MRTGEGEGLEVKTFFTLLFAIALTACNSGTCSTTSEIMQAIDDCRSEVHFYEKIEHNIRCEKLRETGKSCEFVKVPFLFDIFKCEDKKLNYSSYNCRNCTLSAFGYGVFCK